MANVTDQLQRPIRDLRISVTDRCNFRCTYCMPKEVFGDDFVFLPKNELLTFEEIERLARIFADLGVKKYRITGGEPLLRRNLPELIMKLNEIESIEDIGMTTNAILLPRHAHDLYAAGLRRLNISLDALNSDVFGKMNGRGMTVDRVLDAIDLARNIGFYVKVNMVVEKGVNEHEVIPMANYFKERQIPLRFIEFMDVGNDNRWDFKKVVSMKEILTQLQSLFSLEPITATYYGEVAKRYRYTDNGAEVGFISSVSASFCSTCTRARLSSEGKLYTCLFASEGFSLKELLRNGETDQQIKNAIRAVWEKRTDRYSDERAIRMNQRSKINMNYIGG